MSEDRWDLASLSPLTSLAASSSPGNAALPLADGDHVKTSTPDGGSALPSLTRSAVVAQTRAPLRIPPRQNPGRRAKKPIASRRSPSPSEDQDGYSDSGSEWKGIVEDYTGNHSVPLSRLDGISLSSFAPGMFPQFGLDHHAEDFPMGVSTGVSAQGWPMTQEYAAGAPAQPIPTPFSLSASPEAPPQKSPPDEYSPPHLKHLRCPRLVTISPCSPEPYITKSPETRAPSLPAPSIPTSPTHISVWESSPPPDVYHDLPITRQEIVSSVSQRRNHPLPGIPVTSTPLSHHRIEGDHPDSPADSDAGVVPLLESPSSVSILQAQYQALYEDLVELATMKALIERQLEHLGEAANLNEATFA
ncbi:hypothetical protein FA13DRAFT_1797610 [Coprinellus micaceus]|uniref:Uncharacterized protein n=1 Tax=Coprinellus micaceus TaxID=71717 RepID=A0A4Y7SQG0_COPMI|nr:hypothetical protein FA13DRAFT_1797610 [Coprinellus micaceus]